MIFLSGWNTKSGQCIRARIYCAVNYSARDAHQYYSIFSYCWLSPVSVVESTHEREGSMRRTKNPTTTIDEEVSSPLNSLLAVAMPSKTTSSMLGWSQNQRWCERRIVPTNGTRINAPGCPPIDATDDDANVIKKGSHYSFHDLLKLPYLIKQSCIAIKKDLQVIE